MNEVSPLDMPNQSADKSYRSKTRSAIPRSIADSRLKDPNKLTPNKTPRAVDPRRSRGETGVPQSADIYYANDDGKGQPVDFSMVNHSQPVSDGNAVVMTIDSEDNLTAGLERAVDSARNGYGPVRVALNDRTWLQRARQHVEFAVTREQLTEDQAREIQFGLTPSALGVEVVENADEGVSLGEGAPEDFLAPPTEATVPAVSDDDVDLDNPEAFVMGNPEESGSDEEPAEPVDEVPDDADDSDPEESGNDESIAEEVLGNEELVENLAEQLEAPAEEWDLDDSDDDDDDSEDDDPVLAEESQQN